MKNLFRQVIGFIIVIPFVLMVYFFSRFIGKQKAIKFVGSLVTFMAKLALKFFVPKIKSSAEFDIFPSKARAKFGLWRPIYDISVKYEDSDTFKLNISNCPFCEMLNKMGFSELAPYVCLGDWEIAKDNVDKWSFERNHQIGTGDSFCDHTYKRIILN